MSRHKYNRSSEDPSKGNNFNSATIANRTSISSSSATARASDMYNDNTLKTANTPQRRLTSPITTTTTTNNDDLFLNLVNDDLSSKASEDLLNRSEKLRSRLSGSSNKKAPSSYKDNLTRRRGISEDLSPKADSSPINAADGIDGQRYRRDPSNPTAISTSRLGAYDTQSQTNSPLSVDPRLRPLNLPSKISRANSTANGYTNSSPTTSYSDKHNSPIRESLNSPMFARRPSYRPSNLQYATPGSFEYANTNQSGIVQSRGTSQSRSQSQADDASESVDSATAASTVWDELDELKSRIRKLEMTGGSARSRFGTGRMAEMGDRPYTATTRTTTSTSPREKNLQQISPTKSNYATGEVNPLLWSALNKVRSVADPSIYKALESSATDAMELARVSKIRKAQESQYEVDSGDDSFSDDYLCRKAENMCRSLTELCIALCENGRAGESTQTISQYQQGLTQMRSRHEQTPTTQNQYAEEPRSAVSAPADTNYSPLTYLEQRRAREQHRRPSSRIVSNSRPDSRQSSVVSRARSNYTDADISHDQEPSEAPTTPRAALQRSSTNPVTRSRYAETEASGTSARSGASGMYSLHEDRDDTLRAVLPSSTQEPSSESSYRHAQHLKQFSRDYTQKHPLPKLALRDNQSAYSVNSSIAARQPPPPPSESSRADSSRRIPILSRLSAQASTQTSASASRDLQERLGIRRKSHGVASAKVLSGLDQGSSNVGGGNEEMQSESASLHSGYYDSSSRAAAVAARRSRRTTDGMASGIAEAM